MNKKREARRKRDKEDFERVTQQSLAGRKFVGFHVPAGPTYREQLEDKLTAACEKYHHYEPEANPTLRGVIRGLAMALALYEDSYNYSTERVKKIERQFMED